MGRTGLCAFCLIKCSVLIVCRQHNNKEWKFKEQHAKMWENIAGASAPVAPAVPTPLPQHNVDD